jgi:hypothetical protein
MVAGHMMVDVSSNVVKVRINVEHSTDRATRREPLLAFGSTLKRGDPPRPVKLAVPIRTGLTAWISGGVKRGWVRKEPFQRYAAPARLTERV